MLLVFKESIQSFLDFRVWLALLVASAYGASLALINYYAGKKGLPAIQKKFPQLDPEKLTSVDRWYQRWGARVLLLSSLPILGTFLSLGAGAYGIQVAAFMIWSGLSRLIRNWLLFLLFTVVIGSL